MAVVTGDITKEIVSRIGEGKCDDSLPTRMCYRHSHGIHSYLEPDFDFTPGVVVWPESAEDVRQILMIANERKVPVVPRGGGTASGGVEGVKGCIVMDFVRMNKIIEFSETDRRITGEAGVRLSDWIDYAAKRGYMILDNPAMNRTSLLGARASVHGYNKFEVRSGSMGPVTKALEVVLADGRVINIGRGSRVPAKSVVGYNLMDLFIGQNGTLGIITKSTEKFMKIPPAYEYGVLAFNSYKDGLEAYIDLKYAVDHIGPIWRTKYYHKILLEKLVKASFNMDWPQDVEMIVDYHVLGEQNVVDATVKYCHDTAKAHGGFWRDDLPPTNFVGRVHETIEKYMAMGSIDSDRVINGGRSYRIIPLDCVIPNSHLVEFYGDLLELLAKIEDGKSYPNLAKGLHVLKPGSGATIDEGYTKNWSLLNGDMMAWNKDTIREFIDWFREYAEIAWKHNGSLTATHAFVPRALDAEFRRRELGETEYELMRQIKDFFDPNHILNPRLRFNFEEVSSSGTK